MESECALCILFYHRALDQRIRQECSREMGWLFWHRKQSPNIVDWCRCNELEISAEHCSSMSRDKVISRETRIQKNKILKKNRISFQRRLRCRYSSHALCWTLGWSEFIAYGSSKNYIFKISWPAFYIIIVWSILLLFIFSLSFYRYSLEVIEQLVMILSKMLLYFMMRMLCRKMFVNFNDPCPVGSKLVHRMREGGNRINAAEMPIWLSLRCTGQEGKEGRI